MDQTKRRAGWIPSGKVTRICDVVGRALLCTGGVQRAFRSRDRNNPRGGAVCRAVISFSFLVLGIYFRHMVLARPGPKVRSQRFHCITHGAILGCSIYGFTDNNNVAVSITQQESVCIDQTGRQEADFAGMPGRSAATDPTRRQGLRSLLHTAAGPAAISTANKTRSVEKRDASVRTSVLREAL